MISRHAFVGLVFLFGATFSGVVSAQGVNPPSDPIKDLVKGFEKDGMWIEGIAPIIILPVKAKPEQIFEAASKAIFGPEGMSVYRVLEIRKLDLEGINKVPVTAVWVTSNVGAKIMLTFPEGEPTNKGQQFWARCYDVSPTWLVPFPPPDNQLNLQVKEAVRSEPGLLSGQRVDSVGLTPNSSAEQVMAEILKKTGMAKGDPRPVQIRYMTSFDNEASAIVDQWTAIVVKIQKSSKLILFKSAKPGWKFTIHDLIQ